MGGLCEMDMEHETSSLVKQIDRIVHRWDRNYDLFSGGCMFAAAVITKKLRKHNIPYRLKYYTDWRHPSIEEAVKHDDLVHIAVDVEVNSKRKTIGVNYDRKRHMYRFKETCFRTPDQLLRLYKENRWCDYWKKSLNPKFRKEINKC